MQAKSRLFWRFRLRPQLVTSQRRRRQPVLIRLHQDHSGSVAVVQQSQLGGDAGGGPEGRR